MRSRGFGVLGAEQLVGLGQQGVTDPVAGERIELGEEVEHAVGLLADRSAAPAPLAGAPRFEFLLAGVLVDVLLEGAAEQVVGLGLRGLQQDTVVHRRLTGRVQDQTRGFGGDGAVGELVGHPRRPLQLRGHLDGLAGAGPGPLLGAPHRLLRDSVALPPGDLSDHVGLQSGQASPSPAHEPQPLLQHLQVDLVPQRRRTEPLAQSSPLGDPISLRRLGVGSIVPQRIVAHLPITPLWKLPGPPAALAAGPLYYFFV